MSSNNVLKVTGLSKKFCKDSRMSMFYGLQDIAREIIPIRLGKSDLRKNEFWALDNINLELDRGEWLGIIGSNGAGKSTLLKVICGIFHADAGKVYLNGNIGSLLEVNAGLHPVLTGRENIYLKAAIMGVRRCEIEKQINEIIAFSGLRDFIDTPVKFYSSGMQVRLGFSISAFMKPDLFIIDEALAVGDMQFRAKCIERIKLMVSEGVSVLFVSHNLGVIRELCDNAYIINEGICSDKLTSFEAVEKYKKMVRSGIGRSPEVEKSFEVEDFDSNRMSRYGPKEYLEISEVNLISQTNNVSGDIILNEEIKFEITILALKDVVNAGVSIRLRTVDELTLVGWTSFHSGLSLTMKSGESKKLQFGMKNIFRPDIYILDAAVLRQNIPGLIESNVNEEEITCALRFRSVEDPDYPVWQRIYHNVTCTVQ